MTWTVFNPAPGKVTLLHFVVYDGKVRIGLALWQVVFVALVGGYFLWRRQLLPGVIVGGLMAFALAHWVPFPEWKLIEVPFFHPLTLLVSDRNLLVAGTKVIGYAGMILSTIALVITARDADLM